MEDNKFTEFEFFGINLNNVFPRPISKNLEYIKITKKSENKPYSSLDIMDKYIGNIKKQKIVKKEDPKILNRLFIFMLYNFK